MTENNIPSEPMLLPEETAHRILARAVELDAAHTSDIPLATLREIAREAGIGARAFESAVREFQSASSSRTGLETAGDEFRWTRVGPILRNVGAFVVGMGIIRAANSIAVPLGAGWPVEHAVAILANILGVGVALKFRARATAFVLAVTAIAQLAEYPMHLQFGIDTVQGGPTKFALIIASALGLGFGVLARRRALAHSAQPRTMDAETVDPQSEQRTQTEQTRALALRPV
jgi:hypothetical protein